MGRRPWKYDFGTIRLGSYRSFDISTAASIRQSANDYCKRHHIELVVRVHAYRTGTREIRVWRTR